MKHLIFFLLLILFSTFGSHLLAQEDGILLRSDKFSLQVDNVKLEDIFQLNYDISGLAPLGEPLEIAYEDRFSEFSREYTYANLKLTYIDIGEGPVLHKMEAIAPARQVILNNIPLSDMNTLLKTVNEIDEIESTALDPRISDNEKFGDHAEYLEIYSLDGNVVKVIYRHDLQI